MPPAPPEERKCFVSKRMSLFSASMDVAKLGKSWALSCCCAGSQDFFPA